MGYAKGSKDAGRFDKYGGAKEYKEREYVIEERVDEKLQAGNSLPTFKQIFYDLPKSGSIATYCTYYAGVLYFSSLDSHVYAVEASSGKLIWKFKTGSPIGFSSPLVHNNKIYFGSNDEHVYCLNLAGELLWKKHAGDIIVSSVVGIGDRVFVGNGSGYFFCFTEDGKELWKYKTGDGIVAIPSFANDMIFVGSYDKHLYAFDLDGNLKWKFLAGERIGSPIVMENGRNIVSNTKKSFDKTPQLKDPLLVAASYDNHLYAFDQNGKLLWKFNCGSSIAGGIGGENGVVYAGCVNGYIHAIDIVNVKEKWNFLTGGMITGGAEYSDGKVYFVSMDQKLYCLSEAGDLIWDFLTGGPCIARPIVVGNKIFFGSSDTFLYCLDKEKRSVEWTFQTGFEFSEGLTKIKSIMNAVSEYDKKIFKVWVPETLKGKKIQGGSLTGYGMPEGFAFGGEEVYKSSGGAYKEGDLSYFGKKKPYKH